jgi:glycosyltransferase involved in cell wall biosynthesis
LNSRKKIAIICGHFIPNLGYLEVHLANKLADKNFEVCVFTSNKIPQYVKNIAQTNKTVNSYKINRLPAYFSLGQMVLSKHLSEKVIEFNPDTILVIGVGKLFPYQIYNFFKDKEIITLFGDNKHNYNLKSGGIGTRIKQTVLDFIKDTVYRKAIRKSTKLVGYTPETEELLLARFRRLNKQIKNKYQFVSLGFDDAVYYFEPKVREQKRKELGVDKNTLLGVTVTRFNSNKQIETIIDFIEKINKIKPVRYYFLGVTNDAYSIHIKKLIERKNLQNTITLLPFQNDKAIINAFYNAADFGIWTQPAISIIEAKGAGLPVCLPYEKSMDHLTLNQTGLFYTVLDDNFVQKLLQFIEQADRQQIVEKNQIFNYNQIINQIIK